MNFTPEKLDEIRSTLNGFIGTVDYHQFGPFKSILATDGAHFMAESLGAYWLLDVVASYQGEKKVRVERFQIWTLTLEKGSSRAVVTCQADENGTYRAKQELDFTDFPLPEGIKLYCVYGSVDGEHPARIIMLPSEY